ncbi:MAG TPA: MFS transporter [Acetobacteraceae bacterium]|nr:MFS transporter [Acetobacteraceae bacterium]
MTRLLAPLLAPLGHRAVALLWSGLALSAVGDYLYLIALSWIAVGVLGSAAGYLTALGAGTTLLVALVAGRWVDGFEQRRAMLAADLVRAAALTAVVVPWLALGHVSAAPLVAAVLVVAAGQAVFRPALQAMLPALVPTPAELPAANGLFDATDRIARLLGPGIVALLAAVVPAVHFLTLDAASFLGSAAALTCIGRLHPTLALRRAGPAGGALAEVLRGFRAVRREPVLGFELAISGILNGAWSAAFFLGVPLVVARHHLLGPAGAGLGAYGLVISAYGCTNLLATFVVGGRPLPERPAGLLFSGGVVMGAGMLVMAAGIAAGLEGGALLAVLAAGAALGAPGGPMHDIPVAVLRQTRLDRDDLPAAVRASIASSSAGALVAMLAAPALFAHVPEAAAMGLCGAVVLATGLAGLVRFVRPQPRGARRVVR